MAINQPIQSILDKLGELRKNINVSWTIGNTYHIIKLSKTCICDICNFTKSIDLSDIDRHCIQEIILSCESFECNDPLEFIIWELQASTTLNKLTTFNQFVDRNNIISKKINTKIIDTVKLSIPTILRTNIICSTIFDYVGGDYFISLWDRTSDISGNIEMETCIQPLLLCHNGEHDENDSINSIGLSCNIYCIALIDYFGNIICRLSPFFRSSVWSCIHIDDNNKSPIIFTYIGEKMLRWESNSISSTQNDEHMLKLDIAFHHKSDFSKICSSRYWNYSGLSRGICVYLSNIFAASEEHHHVLNNDNHNEDVSSQYVSKICISQISTLTGYIVNEYEINIDVDNNHSQEYETSDDSSSNEIHSSLLNNCDFMVVSSKWLISENNDRICLNCCYCFVLFQRKDKIINFIDPCTCSISRKIKIKLPNHSFSEEMRITFMDNKQHNDNEQIIAYSMPIDDRQDTHPFAFRELNLNVIMIGINGSILKKINLPLGDWIQHLSISDTFIYVDVMLGLFGHIKDKDNHNICVMGEEVVSDEDDSFLELQDYCDNQDSIEQDMHMEWKKKLETNCIDGNMSKSKWFSSSSWRYVLDINNLDILALFSIKHRDKHCKLFKHVNPTVFHF